MTSRKPRDPMAHAALARKWRHKRHGEGLCSKCGNPHPDDGKLYCLSCRAKTSVYHRDYYRRLKEGILEHYGGKCTCCGEAGYEFLTIDHVNEDGAQQRKKAGTRGGVGYFRNIQRTWPTDLQVLCWNCNLAKHHHGSCPHQSK